MTLYTALTAKPRRSLALDLLVVVTASLLLTLSAKISIPFIPVPLTMTAAVEQGLPKMRIEEAAARRQARIDKGEDVIVGVNRYRLEDEPQVDILEIDNAKVRLAQIARLKSVRAGRNQAQCDAALAALQTVAESGEGNLLEAAIEAARQRATLGEISDAMIGIVILLYPLLRRTWRDHKGTS